MHTKNNPLFFVLTRERTKNICPKQRLQTMETIHYWLAIHLEISFIFLVLAHQITVADKRASSMIDPREEVKKNVLTF